MNVFMFCLGRHDAIVGHRELQPWMEARMHALDATLMIRKAWTNHTITLSRSTP